MNVTVSDVIADITDEYLNDIDTNDPPSPKEIKEYLIPKVNAEIMSHNQSVTDKKQQWTYVSELTPYQIAKILCTLHNVCTISFTDDVNDDMSKDIGVYQEEGPNKGIYVTSSDALSKMVRMYHKGNTKTVFEEVVRTIRDYTQTKIRCNDSDLIPVNNGIFDYKTKTLMPFDPDFIFTTKSHVNYMDNPVNVSVHNDADNTDWDVESWMNELSDDKEIVNLLWEVIGAVIRPNVRWNKTVWFYSTKGNNGKGTLCHLMRNICGLDSCTSISLSKLSKDSMLERLPRVSAIITDENDVGTFIDKAAHLKEIATNDVITIDRKYRSSISFRFKGIMVQCLNEMPRSKDKSESFYRRQILVPFEKCFTGIERPYIKDDYLNRPEVLEYVLYRVLHMDYYQLSEPSVCTEILNQYKGYNDPMRQFTDEILPELAWDFVPFNFLYALYKVWYKQNVGSVGEQGRNKFIIDLLELLPSYPQWICSGQNTLVRPGNKMDKPEPLIAEYNLTDWMNPNYKGTDPDKICVPVIKSKYRGISRL